MVDVVKYLDVVSAQEANSIVDGFVVEQCNSYDPQIDLVIVCYYQNRESIKAWIRQNCKRIADDLCNRIDKGGSDGMLAMQLLANTLQIGSYTRELVADCGGVQQFLDKYHSSSQLNVDTDWSGPSTTDFFSTSNLPDESAGISFRDDLEDDFSSDFENKPDAFEDALDSTPEDSFSSKIVGEEGMNEVPVLETGDSTLLQPAMSFAEPEEVAGIAIPADLTGGKEMSVPFNSLVDFANFINDAANQLETSEFAKSYLLQKDGIPYALEYLDAFSPTLLKEFLKHYVESASSDTDFIRVTKLLDSLVEYSKDYEKAGVWDE